MNEILRILNIFNYESNLKATYQCFFIINIKYFFLIFYGLSELGVITKMSRNVWEPSGGAAHQGVTHSAHSQLKWDQGGKPGL